MEQTIPIAWRVGAAFALAVAGGALSAVVGLSHRRLCALISVAAGTLFGVTVFGILPGAMSAVGAWAVAAAVASGYAVFFLLSRYVYHVCPACAASHFDEAAVRRFREIAVLLMVALAVHSTMDGIALAAADVAGHAHEPAGGGEARLDWTLLVAVCAHKMPEGLALGALLLGGGVGRARAVAAVAAVETTTLAGGLVGVVALREASPVWVAAVLAHAGGGFLYLAAHALLGELLKHGKTIVLGGFAAGVALIGLLEVVVRML